MNTPEVREHLHKMLGDLGKDQFLNRAEVRKYKKGSRAHVSRMANKKKEPASLYTHVVVFPGDGKKYRIAIEDLP